jgi:hypothetical protein
MTKPSHPKTTHPASKASLGPGVVRAAKAIPTIEKVKELPEVPARPLGNHCTSHCGHCEIHPCQLHTSV